MTPSFSLLREDRSGARAGLIETPHGSIQTPAFIPVGTKAAVKALSPEQVERIGAEAVLSNTYHLYLQPGHDVVKAAGGLGAFMGWEGPTFTDSGGFQVFSLGAAFGKRLSKVKKAGADEASPSVEEPSALPLANVDDEGVTFKSHLDGSEHRFTPERSMEIQASLGADIAFAFDECPAADAPLAYQQIALDRTHRWAARSLAAHRALARGGSHRTPQMLWGVVQGGRIEALRRDSARTIGAMGFDGFGIGGSFDKDDIGTAVRWVNEELPKDRPRHLLGIGEPGDLVRAVAAGCDTFDCVAPTRMGRNGALYTSSGGRMNILNARYVRDFSPVEEGCDCDLCRNYSRAYLAHLFRAKEMFAATLASIHNLRFLVKLVADMRAAIIEGDFSSRLSEFEQRVGI